MRLAFTDTAERELEAIGDYIALENPARRHLILYRVEDETVRILHILHGAMDYEEILFPEA